MVKKKFIGEFVNGVYGILLGFGLGNVGSNLFENSGQLNDNPVLFVSKVIIFLFVTVVVCLYWWDWNENIESKVKSSFTEFIIDMFILFTLESLFFVFEKPVGLAFLFFILSILNLIWVLNFLWEKHKQLKFESIGYLKNKGDKPYLKKKIYSIFLFIDSLILVIIIKEWDFLGKLQLGISIFYFGWSFIILIWGLRFLRKEHKTNESILPGYIQKKLYKRYSKEKVASIILFFCGFILLIITYIDGISSKLNISCSLNYIITGLIISTVFSVSRYISFRNRPDIDIKKT